MVEQYSFASATTPASTLDAVFHALADRTRRAILRDVAYQEKTVGDLARPYRMSLAAVSKHLDVLERARLIHRVRRGNCRLVHARAERLQAAQEWLRFYETFWTGKLDALKVQLEQDETEITRKKNSERKNTRR